MLEETFLSLTIDVLHEQAAFPINDLKFLLLDKYLYEYKIHN